MQALKIEKNAYNCDDRSDNDIIFNSYFGNDILMFPARLKSTTILITMLVYSCFTIWNWQLHVNSINFYTYFGKIHGKNNNNTITKLAIFSLLP